MDAVPWWAVLRRRWKPVLLLTVLGALAAGAYASRLPPSYSASTTLFFSPSSGSTASELNQGTAYTQNLVRSFAQVATAEQVLRPVVERLDLDTTPARLARSVTATAAPDSLLLTVSVTSPDPQLAARTADAVARELTTVVADLSPVSRTSNRTIKVTTVAEAEVPEAPSDRRQLVLLAGPVLGLLLGTGLAGLRELLDDRVHSPKQVRDVTALDLLGVVEAPASARAAAEDAPSEAVRRLRTNLLAALRRADATSVLVTSPGVRAAPAAASVAVAVATGLVEQGLRVLLVDADVRTAAVTQRLDLPRAPGLAEVVTGGSPLRSALRPWSSRGLQVLTAGAPAADPGALLPSPSLTALLDSAEKAFDVVLVHSAPVLPDADASVLCTQAHTTLVVADSARTTRGQLRRALRALELADATLLGVVLTSRSERRTPRRRWSRRTSPGTATTPPTAGPRTDAPAAAAGVPSAVAGVGRRG